jgi:hypothetical protein
MTGEKLHYFKNFGVLEATIPSNFLERLQIEGVNASDNNKIIRSGLSGTGIPKHFSLKENWNELEQFVLSLIPSYEDEFGYTKSKNMVFENTVSFFKLESAWFNHQKRYEFVPFHLHDGVYSFVIWLNIPYKIEDEISTGGYASCFQFLFTSILGAPMTQNLCISEEWVGKILLFPSKLQHVVYPFYTSPGTRISLSGNINVNK